MRETLDEAAGSVSSIPSSTSLGISKFQAIISNNSRLSEPDAKINPSQHQSKTGYKFKSRPRSKAAEIMPTEVQRAGRSSEFNLM